MAVGRLGLLHAHSLREAGLLGHVRASKGWKGDFRPLKGQAGNWRVSFCCSHWLRRSGAHSGSRAEPRAPFSVGECPSAKHVLGCPLFHPLMVSSLWAALRLFCGTHGLSAAVAAPPRVLGSTWALGVTSTALPFQGPGGNTEERSTDAPWRKLETMIPRGVRFKRPKKSSV